NRSTQLAGFAVVMKAREYDKDLFSKEIDLNLVAIQETPLECPIDEKKYPELSHLWKFFYDAKNYGSILNVEGYDFNKIDEEYLSFIKSYSLTAHFDRELIAGIIKQAKIMSAKYDVVVTNPPYMGTKGMNIDLRDYAKKHFPNTKSDLMTIFMEKGLLLCNKRGYMAMINIPSWMFLSSYTLFRKELLLNNYISSILLNGRGVFGSDFGSVTFVFKKELINKNSIFRKLYDNPVSVRNNEVIKSIFLNKEDKRYILKQESFLKIPGNTFAFWISEKILDHFEKCTPLRNESVPRQGLATGDNDSFLRFWQEISLKTISFNSKDINTFHNSNKMYAPYSKGGEFRKWYGNNELLIKFDKNSFEKLSNQGNNLPSKQYYFKEALTWSFIGRTALGVRYRKKGSVFDVQGSSIFPKSQMILYILGFMCSRLVNEFISILNPTMSFQVGNIGDLPIIFPSDDAIKQKIDQLTQENIDISKEEWDSRETSWDFKVNELIKHKDESNKLDVAFRNYCEYWKEKFFKLHKNEEELNQLFIDIYDLNDELDNKVPLNEITILKEESEIKDDQLVFKKEVIVKQFLSYIVGCMFGRYNPEKEGLILANQGETISDFPIQSQFKPDDDNLIPVTDKDYFPDDIVGKVKEFLKTYFGANNITENLDFIASGLKGSGSSEEKIRRYFLKDFFNDHKKTYKKKPIYWLFTSGKNQGFNTLIYMHRYNKELLAKMRMDYLHELQGKIEANISTIRDDDARSQREKEDLSRQYEEMKKYDELLNHKASEYIEIDLDDGVTVNHAKFKDLVESI
ncbi:MAG: BREX-1 system adenine-specific DNA-methyltransferase PglX, partial [Cryomorphaceae bacterium]|nr:BREX-1 system adenine-specific DNA-methyltransferase PglX [Cryomorphaceae bacterium]